MCIRDRGENGPKSPVTGDWAFGPETLSDEDMKSKRSAFGDDISTHPLDDEYHTERSPQWDKITVPLLSSAN